MSTLDFEGTCRIGRGFAYVYYEPKRDTYYGAWNAPHVCNKRELDEFLFVDGYSFEEAVERLADALAVGGYVPCAPVVH